MPLTAEHHRLASTLDQFVNRTLAEGGGEAALLQAMAAYLDGFKQLLDTTTADDLDMLCQRYSGFRHFARLLEQLAAGIATGQIEVPK